MFMYTCTFVFMLIFVYLVTLGSCYEIYWEEIFESGH